MKTEYRPPPKSPPGRQQDFACPLGTDADDGFRGNRHENDPTTPNPSRSPQ